MKKEKAKEKENPQRHKAYSYVRFSTTDQRKGDSLDRQTEKTLKYIQEHNLELDTTLNLLDAGVSAFKGKNVDEGRLGQFIQAIDNGRVKRGSYLIVESLDRLSRQNVEDALSLFLDIIKKGITIVTLQDSREYRKGQLDTASLFISISVMVRANEESEIKSMRVREARKRALKTARESGKKLSPRCPGWLRYNKDEDEFDVIPKRGEVVKRIFSMSLAGHGKRAITTTLNRERVPTFGKGKAWIDSVVLQTLDNEAVMGIHQPKTAKEIDGKKRRVADGDPIQGYFPGVIDKATFYKAKKMRKERRYSPGRASHGFANLFTGLAKCGQCGDSLHFEHKRKGLNYLVCATSRNSTGLCKRHGWRYERVQTHIICNLFDELDFRDVLPDIYKRSRTEANRIQDLIDEKEGSLEDLLRQIANVTEAIGKIGYSEALEEKLNSLEDTRNETKDDIKILKTSLEEASKASSRMEGVPEALTSYIEVEKSGEAEKVKDSRMRLHQLLKGIIDKMVFANLEDDSLHGTITITFKGINGGYHRLVKVEKGLNRSIGYRVQDSIMSPQCRINDASWPPKFEEGILTPGPFLDTLDQKTGEVLSENPFDEVEEDNDF
jgi:DNA invertase Pin-like site-specific DNA recombinase